MKLPQMTAACTLPYQEQSFAGEHRAGESHESIHMQVVVPGPGPEGPYTTFADYENCVQKWKAHFQNQMHRENQEHMAKYDQRRWLSRDIPRLAAERAAEKCDPLRRALYQGFNKPWAAKDVTITFDEQ